MRMASHLNRCDRRSDYFRNIWNKIAIIFAWKEWTIDNQIYHNQICYYIINSKIKINILNLKWLTWLRHWFFFNFFMKIVPIFLVLHTIDQSQDNNRNNHFFCSVQIYFKNNINNGSVLQSNNTIFIKLHPPPNIFPPKQMHDQSTHLFTLERKSCDFLKIRIT